MADGLEIDTRELEALARSLGQVPAVAIGAARAVVSKGALNIKNDTRKNVSKDPSWKRLAASVNYSMAGNAFFAEAVVGYDDQGQGELAGIYEFGSARRAPHPTLYPAVDRELPKFEAALGLAAAKAVEETL
jgi:hypothetical protein